ncbi:MAG: Rv1355c family protein [Chitinophagaceae bacterium]
MNNTNEVCTPLFFRMHNSLDKAAMQYLIKHEPALIIRDEMEGQLRELIKSNNPSVKIKMEAYPALLQQHLNGRAMNEYGVWIYYPWNKCLVHLLDEEEFIEVRTNRNRYKITRNEQNILLGKKIGIIGLSVGQSIALTLAMERTCGELRLADFDTVELSNLNRIRTGLHNLGLKKTVIAAREICEIDPYLRVKTFNNGLASDNIDEFFMAGGKLDLLVEVCDGLDIKIISRFKARELQVPVVMDTNDRGMLDVERYDLEPDRPILHGLAGDLDPSKITNLTNEEKIPYIVKMIGAETISTRLKASMLEVEQSINTWPQLASSVTLGGAITTDVCRNIFLDQFHDSGRYYIDTESILKDKSQQQVIPESNTYGEPALLTLTDLEEIASKYISHPVPAGLENNELQQLVEAACLAPSGGNAQPWKFLYKNNSLYIFHDAHYSHSLLDHKNLGSYVAFGAMLENIEIKAASIGLAAIPVIFPVDSEKRLIAVVNFDNKITETTYDYLAPVIGTRMTNRNTSVRTSLKADDAGALRLIASTVAEASLSFYDSVECLNEFAEILTNTERLRFLHPRGHYDTFVKELRFTKEEVTATSDGLDVNTLNVKPSDIAALGIAKDPAAISFLHQMHKGSGFKKITRENILTASAIGVVSMNGHDALHFLQGGRAVERVWLEANYRAIALQPISQIVFMTELAMEKDNKEFNCYEQEEMASIRQRFKIITGLADNRYPVFVFRLCYAQVPAVRSLRRPLTDVFFKSGY